jgi:iron complex transport system permease protein
MGHLQPVSGGAVAWAVAWTFAGLFASWAQSRDLNALMLGEEEAVSLGVRVEPFKRTMFLLSSLMTGAAVSVSGLIGFVGLVAPHAARLLVGSDHRVLIPASALAGASLLMAADAVARLLVAPAELPVGVVTALIGGPFFLFLLLRHARELSRRPR